MANETNSLFGSGKTKVWIGVMVVVVAAVIIVSLTSTPPEGEDVRGAIGAAEKYRAEQITDADVSVSETEIQKLMQDDQILAMLKDKELMNAIAGADNAVFQAFVKFGGDLAFALRKEPLKVLEAVQKAKPPELEAFVKIVPSSIDPSNVNQVVEMKNLLGIMKNAKATTFNAFMKDPALVLEVFKTTTQDKLEAYQGIDRTIFEALKTANWDKLNAIKSFNDKTLNAFLKIPPAQLEAIRKTPTPIFEAFNSMNYTTLKAMQGIDMKVLDAFCRTSSKDLKAFHTGNPILMSKLLHVNPLFSKAMLSNVDFKKEFLQRAYVEIE